MSNTVEFTRRFRGSTEQISLEQKREYFYITQKLGGLDAVSKLPMEVLPTFITNLHADRWSASGGAKLSVTKRYGIGEAFKAGFTREQISQRIVAGEAPLGIKARGIAYTCETADSFAKEGNANQRWSDADVASVDINEVKAFVASIKKMVESEKVEKEQVPAPRQLALQPA